LQLANGAAAEYAQPAADMSNRENNRTGALQDDERQRKANAVQSFAPFGKIAPRKAYVLPLDQIHPVIRIAHRLPGILRMPPRILYDHELVLVLTGRGCLTIEKTLHEFGPHDLLFIPPFTPHAFEPVDETEGEHIAIHFDFAKNVPPLDEGLPDREPYQIRLSHLHVIPTVTQLRAASRIEQTLSEIVREFASSDPVAQMATIALMMDVLCRLLRMNSASRKDALSPRNQERVARASAFVHDNLCRELSVPELADVAGLSPSRLHALFRMALGTSPHEFVMRARMDAARQLLQDPGLTIKEIAARTGFDDAYHFSRAFRRIDGLPPTRFRDAVLKDRVRGE